jgi:predicted PurR-regulated permease PerM
VCWRVLVVFATLYVLGQIVGRLYEVLIPVAIALLLSALLAPAVTHLHQLRVPRALGTAIVVVGGLAGVGGVLFFMVNAFIAGFPELQSSVIRSLTNVRNWLIYGPPHLRDSQINGYLHQIEQWLQNNQAALTSGALTTAVTFGTVLTGLVLVLFTLIFFMRDGRRIWLFLLGIVPRDIRERVDLAGRRGFASLAAYVRATALVAVLDALGIWIGLVLIGIPLAAPLAALVFLGAFVPILGSIASGAVAVLVALVAKGWVAGVLVLAVVLAVNQLEGNVMQPLVMGRAVRLHPLAIVLAISAGFLLSGIIGALLAVPLIAALNESIRSLLRDDQDDEGNGKPALPEGTSPQETPPQETGEGGAGSSSDEQS